MTQQHQPSFGWMQADVERVKVLPGEDGLTLRRIMVGRYGEVPDFWPHLTDLPRGASSEGPVALASSYSINDKADVWAENAADLYEEAIQDRWASAIAIPWETLVPLPDEQEAAICQVATHLSEKGYAAQVVIGRWLERIAYGFLEVKSYLATQVFDAGRHCEAFRKRALANGGGLGQESPGYLSRALTDALKWSELAGTLDLLIAPMNMVLLETLEGIAASEAERTLYRLARRDLARWAAYGEAHIGYHLDHKPDRRRQLSLGLSRGDQALVHDMRLDTPMHDALVILLAQGGRRAEGKERLAELRQRQYDAYLASLARAGLPEHEQIISRLLRPAMVGAPA
ncbi:MAG: hypothetical protein HYX51_00250 [Chloroflexi bacterium]|nr:hypothetical protein [Chloroflexota bacterium]